MKTRPSHITENGQSVPQDIPFLPPHTNIHTSKLVLDACPMNDINLNWFLSVPDDSATSSNISPLPEFSKL